MNYLAVRLKNLQKYLTIILKQNNVHMILNRQFRKKLNIYCNITQNNLVNFFWFYKFLFILKYNF